MHVQTLPGASLWRVSPGPLHPVFVRALGYLLSEQEAAKCPTGAMDVPEKILIIKNLGDQLSCWRWCQEDERGPRGRKR